MNDFRGHDCARLHVHVRVQVQQRLSAQERWCDEG